MELLLDSFGVVGFVLAGIFLTVLGLAAAIMPLVVIGIRSELIKIRELLEAMNKDWQKDRWNAYKKDHDGGDGGDGGWG